MKEVNLAQKAFNTIAHQLSVSPMRALMGPKSRESYLYELEAALKENYNEAFCSKLYNQAFRIGALPVNPRRHFIEFTCQHQTDDSTDETQQEPLTFWLDLDWVALQVETQFEGEIHQLKCGSYQSFSTSSIKLKEKEHSWYDEPTWRDTLGLILEISLSVSVTFLAVLLVAALLTSGPIAMIASGVTAAAVGASYGGYCLFTQPTMPDNPIEEIKGQNPSDFKSLDEIMEAYLGRGAEICREDDISNQQPSPT